MKKIKEEFNPESIQTEFQNQRNHFRKTWGKALKLGKEWRKSFMEDFEDAQDNFNEKLENHERRMEKLYKPYKNIFGNFASKQGLPKWKSFVTKRPPMTTNMADKGVYVL